MSVGWVVALAAGTVAAMLHLVLTWLRTSIALNGGAALAMLTLPVAIAMPVACLLAGIWLSPGFGWLAILSYWLLRSFTAVCVVRL